MGYYFVAIGTVISLFAVWSFVSRIKLLLLASRSQGVIVGFDEQLRYVGQIKKIYYHPVIEFETAEGTATSLPTAEVRPSIDVRLATRLRSCTTPARRRVRR